MRATMWENEARNHFCGVKMKRRTENDREGRVSPGSESIDVLQNAVAVSDVEKEVIRIMSARATFSAPETRAMAVQLLTAGYAPAEVARRMRLHPGAVYDLAREPEVKTAIEAGVERRRAIVGHGLQHAAQSAVETLQELMLDPGVPPKERIKAAETLLDRSGIAPDSGIQQGAAGPVTVDVDFDQRLARIVAGGGSSNLGD